MSSARKCDRCGKLYDSPLSVPDIRIVKYQHPYGEEAVDLCKNCQNDLEAFMRMRRVPQEVHIDHVETMNL